MAKSLPSDSPYKFNGTSAPLRVAKNYPDKSGGTNVPQRVVKFMKHNCSPT